MTAPAIQVLDLTRKSRQRAAKIDLLHPQEQDLLIVGNPAMPSIGNPPQQLPRSFRCGMFQIAQLAF